MPVADQAAAWRAALASAETMEQQRQALVELRALDALPENLRLTRQALADIDGIRSRRSVPRRGASQLGHMG
jgi:ferric-dicitrate binding protein FerR (iron transport regulator)